MELTLKQTLLIAHTIGIDLFKSVMSLKKKDKQLPKVFYRNYYNVSPGGAGYDDIKTLVDLGLMEQFSPAYFRATEKGIKHFKKRFNELAIYKTASEMDLEYLKHRINFYCDFHNYRFCNNNYDHIQDAYLNYFVKKFYVSHTTKDVINRFKSELKKFLLKPISHDLHPTPTNQNWEHEYRNLIQPPHRKRYAGNDIGKI